MAASSNSYCPGLITNNESLNEVALPNVKRIKNIREFMADPTNYDGNIDKLIGRMANEATKCQEILKVLKEEVLRKTGSLRQIKADMMQLQQELKSANAGNRFAVGHEKILVKFTDESEGKEYDVPQALECYSLKMSSLFGEILALDSDVDYVVYLEGIAQLNKQYVRDWYDREYSTEQHSKQQALVTAAEQQATAGAGDVGCSADESN
ncbi:uncharacterized protein LOC115634280 [Scaptodrosophila lebanonensis]|uniref:Uncharacterized protein LOC115634280 n=1 Tax=Drosophila lebanonensis TaxID=7225 RepID=A0A6J2UJV8_DROLE|nr:uncharacterized protein LOC115634280 [Scaptodrosophila lebanonensis]